MKDNKYNKKEQDFEKTPDELLRYAVSNGIINVSDVAEQIKLNERKKYLEQHKYSIWQAKNGGWYTKVYDEIKDKKVLVKRTNQRDLEDFIIQHYKRLENEPTIQKIFEEWVEQKIEYNEIGMGTAGRYKRDFNRYFELFDFKNRRISWVTEEDIEAFIRKTISSNNLTAKAYSNVKTLILGIFKYAKKKKWTSISITNVMGDLDLSARVFANRIVFKEKEIFFEDEIEKIVENIHHNPTIKRLGILLAFETGMRVGELCSLKKSDIGENYIHVQRTEIEYPNENGIFVIDVKEFPKTSAGDRYIYVNDQTMETIRKIEELNPTGEYLFCKDNSTRGYSRIYGRNFNPELKKICEEVGIPPRTMHKIRKTYGTTLLDAGVDESFIIEQMGHSDIECTKKYYYFSNKHADKKLQQIKDAISI